MSTNRTPRTEEGATHLVWVVFYYTSPECWAYAIDELDSLCGTYIGYLWENDAEERNIESRRACFRKWLLSLPFGVITKIPNSDDTIVVVRKGAE